MKHSNKFKAFLLTIGLLLAIGSGAGRSGTLETSFNQPPKCTNDKRVCPDGLCLDKNAPCGGRQFLRAANFYFSGAKDQKTVDALLGLMKEQMEEFVSRAQKLTKAGCGPDQKQCLDGSCAPIGNKCELPHEYKEYSRVFQKAAGYYYTNAKEPEAVEELLRERFKHFTIGARKLTGLGCPDKMMECPGGFCVLTGRKCD
jgi:hypothetical protein